MNNADLRYHIASLSAIFLALGIGILVGTAFVGTPIVSRQTGLIKNLETNVGHLRHEMREQERTEEALRVLLPRIVQGALAGKRVLVVQMGGYADAAALAAESLAAAGAVVETATLPPDGWRARLARPEETADAVTSEARRLAPLLLTGGASDSLQTFRDAGLVAGDNDADGGAVHLVVLVGGETDGADLALLTRRDVPMIETWQNANVTVVAAEPLKAVVSYLPLYRGAGIATVDAIDRAAGRIALPFALRGERAAYGYRPDAERVLPASLDGLPPVAPTPSPTATLSEAIP